MKFFVAFFLCLFVSFPVFAEMSDTNNRATDVSFNRGTANLEKKEVSGVTCRADVGGNLGGKYFLIYSALDAVKYAVWYDVDDGSTAPTVAGATLVEVDIATGDLNTVVATNTKTSLDAITGTPFVTVRTDEALAITNSEYGATTDIADVDTTHTSIAKTTDGVSATAAILSTNLIPNMRGFKICNDAVNTPTYLIVGWADVVTETGVRLAKGACFECDECNKTLLETMKVSAQADSDGYGIVQWRKQ